MFLGFVTLGDTGKFTLQCEDGSRLPKNPASAPYRQVYGPGGLVTAASGQAAKKHTGTVTGATSGNPTVITSTAHGLETGAKIYISGLVGLTDWADDYYTVTKTGANTFTVPVSTTGSWSSGGTWNVAGLYEHSVACTAGNGFQAGSTYTILTPYDIGGTIYHALDTFTVV